MERRADPSIQLEIDEAILDYLLYMAVTVLLGDAKSKSKAKVRKLDDSALCKQRRPAAQTHIEPDVSLQMVDCRFLNANCTQNRGLQCCSFPYHVPLNAPRPARFNGATIPPAPATVYCTIHRSFHSFERKSSECSSRIPRAPTSRPCDLVPRRCRNGRSRTSITYRSFDSQGPGEQTSQTVLLQLSPLHLATLHGPFRSPHLPGRPHNHGRLDAPCSRLHGANSH